MLRTRLSLSLIVCHWLCQCPWTTLLATTPLAAREPSRPESHVDFAASELRDASRAPSSHWAFRPVARLVPPRVLDKRWIRNEIDRFVLARLETLGIAPSPKADRHTLIRRLHLDLIGLPPKPEDVRAFANSDDPRAYEELVDRLLVSPHYGERWGRHWLDQARYADSHGYDIDQARPHAWRYRHWVVEALNRDLPFDQFTIEQLAGDLLPAPTNDQLVATGFHRNTLRNTEAGADPEEDRVKQTFDRAETTATVWLGLTLGCARCHDHKYDPVSQREYYEFYAFFNNLEERDVPAPLPEDLAAYPDKKVESDRRLRQMLDTRRKYEERFAAIKQRAWEARLSSIEFAHWRPLKVIQATASKGEQLVVQDDLSILAEGPTPDESTYTIVATTDLKEITGIRLEVLPHASLPQGGPGRAPDGDFDLTSFSVTSQPITIVTDDARSSLPPPTRELALMHPAASHQRDDRPFGDAIGDHGQKSGWSIGSRGGERHVAVVELREPIQNPTGTQLTFTLRQGVAGWFQVLGCFRLSVTGAPLPFRVEEITNRPADSLAKPSHQRSEEDQARIRGYYCSRDPQWITLNNAVLTTMRLAPKDPHETLAQTLAETSSRRETCVFERGEFQSPGAVVAPGTPSALPELKARGARPDRLDLARWVVDPANPLTARVAVNRVWQQYFGRGLVATEDDFGLAGDWPTHLELLDWLANDFVDSGWSLKHLHKRIVMSATYRQASSHRTELIERDPHNQWLARQMRLRVDAEVVHDSALFVSGLLNEKVGGPSVVLPQPSGQDDLAFNRARSLEPSWGPELFRRGIYIWMQRTSPYPELSIFDAPSSNVTCTRRQRSTTPMQALTLLNDSFHFECARALGKHVSERSFDETVPQGLAEQRLSYLFELCLARPPRADELSELKRLHAEHREFYDTYQDLAREVTVRLDVEPTDRERLSELATWVVLARIVFNLDEFIVRP